MNDKNSCFFSLIDLLTITLASLFFCIAPCFSMFSKALDRDGISLTLILGYSTGHVGTTTLGDKHSYNHVGDDGRTIAFVFERGFVNKSLYFAGGWTEEEEVNHIESVYGPYILTVVKEELALRYPGIRYSKQSVKSVVVVDMSHSNLYFFRGASRLAKEYPSRLSVTFVRIRRDRIETILSMSSDPKFFEHELAVYHPDANQHDVILSFPNRKIWQSFNHLQKCLWVVDETEARWQMFLKRHPGLAFIELLWGYRWEGSMNASMHSVSRWIGTQLTNPLMPPHLKAHADANRKSHFVRIAEQIVKSDRAYMYAMNFTYVPG